ncbi:glycine oxidase [Paenibacillus sp. UNCCL117]|uniref:glycine oxidase ThiO n=1 Tax=unclassified Paenibacillus TaxID=185978 RepID=UPI00088A0A8D|nr:MULTISPECIES: glycine oxidase ThiO [unclassified Paenibacillus]SDC18909.1 glycine oxidase [Paenibacillus sp. cl123]SFW18295.1 glycine oxidase [Paenibacillus sp. UNCCL117]
MITNLSASLYRESGPSALIIGGGVIGAASAYELGKAGYACTVLDKGGWSREASTAAAGMLGAQVEIHQAGPFYELCRASLGMYRNWTSELEASGGISAQYIAEGIVRAAMTDEDEAELLSRLPWMQDAEWMTAEELLRIESELSPAIRGGLYLPADHQVHPHWLAKSLKAAILRQGCVIREWTPATRLLTDCAGRVIGAATPEHELHADVVILAAGAWSSPLTEPLGLKLPMFPVKGQCISVRTDMPLISSTVFTKGCYIVPKSDGTSIIGASQQQVGFDKRATAAVIAELHEKAAALLPRIADAEFVDTWTGLRPGTEDGLPFIGKWEQAPGLIVATGHYRNGILLAPVTGRLVAQLAQGLATELDLAPFAPSRTLTAPHQDQEHPLPL